MEAFARLSSSSEWTCFHPLQPLEDEIPPNRADVYCVFVDNDAVSQDRFSSSQSSPDSAPGKNGQDGGHSWSESPWG